MGDWHECPDTSDYNAFPHGPGREPNGFYLPGKCRRADKCKIGEEGAAGEKDRGVRERER